MYHNHATEFFKGTEGKYAVEMLDADSLEIDVYWAAKNANLAYSVDNVLDFITANADKISLLHIKDGLDGSSVTGEMCGWGKGAYDIQSIIDLAKAVGVTSVVVENDKPGSFGLSGLEDALQTAEYAKTLDFAK